jgi:hypothetical protein
MGSERFGNGPEFNRRPTHVKYSKERGIGRYGGDKGIGTIPKEPGKKTRNHI